MRHSIVPLLVALTACGVGSKRGEALTSSSADLQVCAGASTVRGIDVSDYQGNIDWNQVAAAGYAFGYSQTNDGHSTSTTFARNWSEMKRVGILRGAYQFFEPGEDPSAQAQIVVAAVGKLGPGDLPVMLDLESGSPTSAELSTWMTAVNAVMPGSWMS